MAEQEQTRGRRGRKSRQRRQREAQEAQRRQRYMIVGGVIVVALVALVVASIAFNGGEEEDPFPPVQAAQPAYENIEHEAYLLGDPDAPVHLIEWSDYQ